MKKQIKKPILLIGISLLTFVLLFFIACNKDNIQTDLKNESKALISNGLEQQRQYNRIQFAKILAKAMGNSMHFRSYVKEKLAIIDADGGDFTYSLFAQDVINGVSVSDILTSTSEEMGIDPNFINSIISSDPLMTIVFPDVETFSLDTWDVNSKSPSVATEPLDNEGIEAVAFDENAREYTLLVDREPDNITLGIHNSEIFKGFFKDTKLDIDGNEVSVFLPHEIYSGELLIPCPEIANDLDQIKDGEVTVIRDGVEAQLMIVSLKKLDEHYRNICFPPTLALGSDNGDCERDIIVADENLKQFLILIV